MSSLPPLPPVPVSPRYSQSSISTYKYQDNADYHQCMEDAANRKAQGKIKLCPEGYCTAKLTEEVYPSYWANLRASKICTGQEEDYEGNVENYYQKYNQQK